MKCITCVFGATCGQPRGVLTITVGRGTVAEKELIREEAERPRADCLPEYKHYVEGDPRIRLLELQRSGEINIVIGGEGEHEVNAKWSVHEAYKHLAGICNECGGLVTHDSSIQLVLGKPYGPTFVLEWMHGRLYKISIREHTVWWEAE